MDKDIIEKYLDSYAKRTIQEEINRLQAIVERTTLPKTSYKREGELFAELKELLFATPEQERVCISEIKQRRLNQILENVAALQELQKYAEEGG